MSWERISDIKKRMEYNLTEPETLIKLVYDAINKGEKVQGDMNRLQKNAEKIVTYLEKESFFKKKIHEINYPIRAVGIDGSFQLVGGAGGQWFSPISVARIIFDQGLGTQPEVDVFWAGIEEIEEKDDPKPNIAATMKMLIVEGTALLNWGTLGKEAIVFIDGPVVDPPVFSIGGREYVKDRCKALNKCLEKSILIGIVKRSRDNFIRDGIIKKIPKLKNILYQYPSDQHLMAYLFSTIRMEEYNGPIYTNFIKVSESNTLYKEYNKNNIDVYVSFFQKDTMSQVIRLDFSIEKEKNIDDVFNKSIKATYDWIYPYQNYPLPIILAHNKCNIREGCAQVLYEEILTRSMSTDPRNQMIITQLR